MPIENIIEYMTKTPGNTNPNVLREMLTELEKGSIQPEGNQDITTLDEYDVTYKATARISAEERAKIIAANIKPDVEILGVPGAYTSDADAVASDIASGKTAYVNGEKITGTAENSNPFADYVALPGAGPLFGYSFGYYVTDELLTRLLTPTSCTKTKTDMSGMFGSCGTLTTIPLIDTSNATKMSDMFQDCSKLTTVPLLNTGNVTEMCSMFENCKALTTIPQFNTSKVTTVDNMFAGCSALTTIPLIDTSSVKNMTGMFAACGALTTVPLLNTSNVTNMYHMFGQCRVLTTIPQFNTSKVTNMESMFAGCDALTTIPLIDTSNVTSMENMFDDCSSLTSVPQLNINKATSLTYMVRGCSNLEEIHMMNIGANLDISASTKFTREALLEIIGNLKTVTSTKKLTMGATNLAKLTAEDKAIATNKGWTLA